VSRSCRNPDECLHSVSFQAGSAQSAAVSAAAAAAAVELVAAAGASTMSSLSFQSSEPSYLEISRLTKPYTLKSIHEDVRFPRLLLCR